jgi:SAM-dependent methyltransferase
MARASYAIIPDNAIVLQNWSTKLPFLSNRLVWIAFAFRSPIKERRMAIVNYTHALNWHSLEGAMHGMGAVLSDCGLPKPMSLLDVGAGSGHWLRAALECGVTDVLGVDGVPTDGRSLEVKRDLIVVADLREELDLGKKFDVVICLEVAEHLDEKYAAAIIGTLCRHSDVVYFSAAVPNQFGDHHVNCQWPEYWQTLFNDNNFACDDGIRKRIWNMKSIEPWYRQNMMRAIRSSEAGLEPRILPCIHPDMLNYLHFISEYIGGRTHAIAAARALMRRLTSQHHRRD